MKFGLFFLATATGKEAPTLGVGRAALWLRPFGRDSLRLLVQVRRHEALLTSLCPPPAAAA